MPEDTSPSIQPAAAFQALPIQSMIAAPLVAVIQAQQQAAIQTEKYIKSFIEGNGKPLTVEFSSAIVNSDGTSKDVKINAPLLSIVPVPHISVNELITHFKFEVSHVRKEASSTNGKLEGSASAQGIVSKFVDFSLSGSVASDTSRENTSNQSGILEITVKASEAPMPAGLQKILDILTQSITV